VVVSLTPHPTHVHCVVRLDDMRDLSAAIARCRRLLDLDADPEAVDGALAEDPALAQLILAAPGQRIPRTVDEAELAVRVVIGQQVSLKAARTHLHRLVVRYGTPIADPDGGLTHLFPTPADLIGVTDGDLAFPASRQRTVRGLVRALAEGAIVLDPGSDWQQVSRQLLALPGVGPWTAEMIAMRGLGDPDAFPATDLGVQLAATQLGLPTGKQLSSHGQRWRPWRSYATQYLWTSLPGEVNTWPPPPPVPAKNSDSDRRRRARNVAAANGASR
jgi:AraC family transcriptional regulator of adaptative response / DNA-3-methyladenine glycosylase II